MNSNEGEGYGRVGEGGVAWFRCRAQPRLHNRHLFYWFWFVFFKPFVQDFPNSHVFQFKTTSESGIPLFPFHSYDLDLSWKGLIGKRMCVYLFIHSIILSNYDVFISVINQLDAQYLFHNKFYFMPLHVSSTCVHHQEVKIALHSLWYHHTYRCDDTRAV